MALAGDFVEDRADAAASRIADDVNVLGRIQHGFDSPPQGAQSLVTSASMPNWLRARRIVQP